MTDVAAESSIAARPSHRDVRAPRGTQISCKSWQQEAALRMLMNNLDPEVAERPQDLVVYGGTYNIQAYKIRHESYWDLLPFINQSFNE